MREAREVASDRAVLVHGAGAAQALLLAGLLDEMEIHLVQVLLGGGRRLFEGSRAYASSWSSSADCRR